MICSFAAYREIVSIGDVPDAAPGTVDDATQRHLVGRVRHRDEVCEGVLDLGALVELGAAHDLVRQRRPDEDLLQRSALRVGAIEDGHLRVVDAAAPQRLDLVRHELRLVVLRVAGEAYDLLARSDVGPELLVLAVEVVSDDRVGRAEDVLRRAVVLLEQHHPRARVVALELGDVADVGAAERVDRLIGVADHGEGCRRPVRILGRVRLEDHHPARRRDRRCVRPDRPGQLADQRVLGVVGVLVLVDEDVPESPTVDVGDVREGPEQVDRLPDEVVEVERVGALQGSLVVAEHIHELALGGVAHVRRPCVRLGVGQFVLELRDAAHRPCRSEPVGIRLVLLDQALDQRARIAGVVDREGLREAELLGLTAEDPHARRVERRDPHALRAIADQLADAVAHLTGRLVGERDCEDLARPGLSGAQERGHPAREDAGLARPGAGDDEQGGAAVGDRLALRRVQPREQVFVGARDGSAPDRGPRSPPTMIRGADAARWRPRRHQS